MTTIPAIRTAGAERRRSQSDTKNHEAVDTVKVLEKAIAILRCLAGDGRSWSVTELSQRLGYSKATVYRILNVLERNRLLFQEPQSRRYVLGVGVQELAHSLSWREELKVTAFPIMRSLRDQTMESVCLYCWDMPLEFACVLRVDSPNVIRPVEELGRPIPVGRGATSRVVLALHWEQTGLQGLQRLLQALPKESLAVPPDQLLQEVLQTAQDGFATTAGERYPDAASIAAPVRGAGGRGIAVLTLFGPSARLSLDRRLGLVPAVREAAGEITRSLGTT